MSWLPWLLLLALVVAAVWCFAEIAGHVRWARRALLADGGAPRPQGWLVRKLRLEELFVAIERRAANEGEIRAAAARRIEALLAPLTDAEADVVIGMQKTEAVARVVSEPSPAETAQAQALAAPAEKPLFEQMPGTAQSTVATPAAQVQQPIQPQVTPAAAAVEAHPAPVAQATGFGEVAPVQQTAAPAPTSPNVTAQAAGIGFGAVAPAAAQPAAGTEQSFPGAADGTKPLPQADANFDAALDARLTAIIGPAA